MAHRPRDGEYFHIEIERQPQEPQRRRRRAFFPPVPAPPDRNSHATMLDNQTTTALDETVHQRETVGIDPTKLLVLEFNSVNYDTRDDFVERFQAQVVDESVEEAEDKTHVRTVVQFDTDAAIQKFQREIAAYLR